MGLVPPVVRTAFVVVALLAVGCTATATPNARRVVLPETPAAAPPERTATAPIPTMEPTPVPVVEIRYRVDVRVPDAPGFGAFLAETMEDPRGWTGARFRLVEDPSAEYVVVLAEGDETHELCLPYDVGGEFSCQNGPVVAINAKRWRAAVPHWPSSLDDYRRMLLNHEMGHLLGQRHVDCTPGEPAPVMYQQSGALGDCLANPWPLPWEIERAARHDQPLAPGYGE